MFPKFLAVPVLLLSIPYVSAYCPQLLQGEEACTCFAYVDGAVIKCQGLRGPAVIEKLKTVRTEIRELSIQDANIVEVCVESLN